MRYGGRRRYAVQGAETSGVGCQLAGVGDVQVGIVLLQGKRWG